MVSNSVSLAVDVFLFITCILQILANFLVLFVWFTSKRLYRNENLILLISLAFIDFSYAVLQFPYLIILIAGMKPNGVPLNYNPWVIVHLGGPSAALMKAGCTITVAIAFDRVMALYFPVHYYQHRKACWSVGAFVFALVLTFIDWIVLQLTVTIKPVPGCGSFGCFTNEIFRAYWGLSNMVVNLIACLLTLVIIYQLFKKSKAVADLERKNRAKIDRNANRVAIYILLVSAVIGVVPGCLNGVTTIVNLPVLSVVSFFVGTSATLSGLSHAFIFGIAHRDIKYAILNRITKHGAVEPTTRMEVTSHIARSSCQKQVPIQ
ncbi:hypothetical protein Angca_000814 [Angiostrongylus cantonensis]|uniref:G_PROTEIN_RECEP_F1_2 domain-containing protein n=1 Tax=Angiostrongylus cantonensis TaxID=6313 RepID=A0A0K0DB61_ANGCA|nr:hypothetical protein Angca_000814 [Angiostrongylus cantonensis]